MGSHRIDSSISFSLPTYVVLKDDIVSDELREQLSKVKNLTLVTDVSVQTINNLRVCSIQFRLYKGFVHPWHLQREGVQ